MENNLVENNDIKYDKVNGDVYFIEDVHKYGNIKYPKLEYMSVTTIIGKYHEEFNKDFWSSYKAIERIVSIPVFKTMSIRKMLLSVKKWDDKYLDLIDINKEEFFATKQIILDEYVKNNKEACDRGTAYHLKRELEFYEKDYVVMDKYINDDTKLECKKYNWDLNRENAILPEYLVYYSTPDGLLNIAGQIDVLIKRGNDIYVLDFKTNKDGIESKAYFNQQTKQTKKMYYPINNIEDTTLNHYALQLSFYAFMLKQINPNFNVKMLKLIHDAGQGETEHEVKYYENEVKKIMIDLWKCNKLKREKEILSLIK